MPPKSKSENVPAANARSAPRAIQEQAFRMRLIPYIPGEPEE